MPGPNILLSDTLRAADPLKWQAVFTGAQHAYAPDGLLTYGAAAYPNYGLVSLGTFSRTNLVLVFTQAAYLNTIGNFFGYANDLPGTLRAIQNGTFAALNNDRIFGYGYSGGVLVESVNGGTVLQSTAPVQRFWGAMKLLGTGALIKWRKGDAGPWTAATNNPATGSATNLNVVVGVPYSAGVGVVWGVAAEQSDGDFSDARLDAIVTAANLRPGYAAANPRHTLAARALQIGRSNVVTVELQDGDRPLTGVAPAEVACTLVKNGVAGAKTLTALNFTEVDAVNAPGLYRLVLDKTDVNALGELVVMVTPPAGSWRFAPFKARCEVTALEAMTLNAKTAGLSGLVTVKDADGLPLFSTQYKRVDTQDITLPATHFGGHGGWSQT